VSAEPPVEAGPPRRPLSGEHERHLAVSALAQQASQVVAILSMLAAITVLARQLTLPEFGTYGLLVSLTTYVAFAQATVETAAVKAIAEARDQSGSSAAFSTAVTFYVVAGVVAGAVIAGVGTAVLGLFTIPASLQHEAHVSVLALGLITAVGWPLKAFQDVLRGSQFFVASAVADGLAFLVVGAALVGLGLGRAALWILVSVGASVPFTTGVLSAAVVWLRRLPYRYRRSLVTSAAVRSFFALSANLFLSGIADLVIYALDRAILATFRSAAVVGLYEGPVRAHNLVLQGQSAFATPIVSVSARYAAERDEQRMHDLLLRGTRYMLATIVPPTLVLTILAKPVLAVWLGPRFAVAAVAMSLLVGYWLLNAGVTVGVRMLIASGRARTIAVYAGAVALTNLALSLALTPSLGLNGVVLGTTLAYALGFPFFIRLTVRSLPVTLAELAQEAWLPAYLTGAIVAAGLLAVRFTVSLDSVPKVLGAAVIAIFGYWVVYYAVWLRPNERALVRNLIGAPLRRPRVS
jgi:O-antigen/teichoic acid export membrane protein